MSNASQTFVGQSLVFPFTITNGSVGLTTDEGEIIKSSIRCIVLWGFGTRYYMENFGSKVVQALEDPNDVIMESLVVDFTKEAISKWESRIEELEIEVVRNAEQINLVMNYRIKNSQSEDSYTLPFYRDLKY